ncbi:signal peptidase I [Flavobacterium jejuense]|uniref:Signal peptidase I n=1 Tax=Flavobacterium jejuense TaxID=1544455 RepID=A0ABX0IQ48_9FLAO|nr:signal peptidase I [Flavobacterium jejuense]NHN25321.1 signal peptidase I [Flavobacterium jejuense]
MSVQGWLLFILLVQVIHGLGTWKLYVKAGRQAWEAFVPIYNSIVLMKIINRSTWWTLLLFIPVINLFMFPIIWIETLRTFGKKTTLDMVLGVVTIGFYIMYVNYTQEVTYFADRDLKAPTKAMDTLGSLAFAIIVATFVHTYFIQPYVIPTSSLEKSLLIGDFLFVSKFNYGARTPMTPIAAPMVHDSLPLIGTLSYLKKPQLPYFRFPKLEKIKNNDIVVFNWPRDTLDNMYHPSNRRIDKPIDKKTNYVKRCVGIAGDSLEIKGGIVFINGKELILPERAKPQYSYNVAFDRNQINIDYIVSELSITDGYGLVAQDTLIFSALTFDSAERLKNFPGILNVKRNIRKGAEDGTFPDFKDGKASPNRDWNGDNFGPIYIPEAGKTVALTKESLPLYKIIITEYEGNTLEVNGDEIKINGQVTKTYTFKQNYYWMMGDNRHNSLDARYFGYTPEDHIVGKPVFIWMSWNSNGKGINKIRWERLFTTVSGDGQPKSYFKYFLVLLALYFVGEHFYKKKKKEKESL